MLARRCLVYGKRISGLLSSYFSERQALAGLAGLQATLLMNALAEVSVSDLEHVTKGQYQPA